MQKNAKVKMSNQGLLSNLLAVLGTDELVGRASAVVRVHLRTRPIRRDGFHGGKPHRKQLHRSGGESRFGSDQIELPGSPELFTVARTNLVADVCKPPAPVRECARVVEAQVLYIENRQTRRSKHL